jgi:hypothetical protein
MPLPSAELWCAPAALASDLRRSLERRGLRVSRVLALPDPLDPAALPAPARGSAVVVVVLDAPPASPLLDALAASMRAAKTTAVLACLGAGASRAPVLAALAARRGLGFAQGLDTLGDLAGVVAVHGPPRGGRLLILARSGALAREVATAASRRGVTIAPAGPRLAALAGGGGPKGMPLVLPPKTSAATVRRALAADDAFDVVAWVGRRPAGPALGGGVVEVDALVPDGAVPARRGTLCGADRLVSLLAALGHSPSANSASGASTPTSGARTGGRRKPPPVFDREATLGVLDGPPRTLSDPSSKRALAPYGIPFVREVLCTSASSAERAARDLTPPLVAKVASPDLPMGPDAPGVVTGIPNAPQARTAYHAALRAATKSNPKLRVLGVRIGEQTPGLALLRVRLIRGPDGAVVLAVGAHGPVGGVAGDLELTLPASREDIACLLDASPWRILWTGEDGRPAGDRAALLDLLVRASSFADDLVTRVSAVILDPVVVRDKGRGAFAADAQVTVG